MATVFMRLIEGEVPARFVRRDDSCAAFLNIAPSPRGTPSSPPEKRPATGSTRAPGWLAAHLMSVSQAIGKTVQESFGPEKFGLTMAGLEVPHVHVWPVHGPISFPIDPDEEDPPEPDWEELDEAAGSIRRALKDLGFQHHVAD